jgi:hypothetical protein
MMHSLFGYRAAFSGSAGQDFGANERTCAGQFNVVKDFSFEQFEGAIHIPDPYTEQPTHQFCPAPAIDSAYEIVTAVQPVTGNDIIPVYQRQQRRQLGDIKLAVAVGIKDEVFCRGLKAGPQGRSVAEVCAMVHHLYFRVLSCDFVGEPAGPVGAAIVDDNHLEVGPHLFEDAECLLDGPDDIVPLIITGEENADRDGRFMI